MLAALRWRCAWVIPPCPAVAAPVVMPVVAAAAAAVAAAAVDVDAADPGPDPEVPRLPPPPPGAVLLIAATCMLPTVRSLTPMPKPKLNVDCPLHRLVSHLSVRPTKA